MITSGGVSGGRSTDPALVSIWFPARSITRSTTSAGSPGARPVSGTARSNAVCPAPASATRSPATARTTTSALAASSVEKRTVAHGPASETAKSTTCGGVTSAETALSNAPITPVAAAVPSPAVIAASNSKT